MAPSIIYLPDLKFGPGTGPDSCGERIGGMPDYWAVVTGCIDRVMDAGHTVLVRHLLMPGHFDCCTAPVLTWLAERPALAVSLLTQYLPPAHVRGSLADSLAEEEVAQAQWLARRLGLKLVR